MTAAATQSNILARRPGNTSSRDTSTASKPAAAPALAIADDFTQHLVSRIGQRKYSIWFDKSARFNLDRRALTLKVEVISQFNADWVRKNFTTNLKAAAADVLEGRDVELTVVVSPDTFGDTPRRAPAMETIPQPPRRPRPSTLRHRLDDFVVGPCNELAFAAAQRLASGQHDADGPLFLHGSCGLGKTHLLQAVAHAFAERDPQARVLYTTGERFTNDYITAVRTNKLDAFRKSVRRLDLLAVDDIHFLANKKATQQEFLHCFEHIELGGAKVVLASDSHPKLIQQFSEALVSRCVRGLVVQVHTPDLKTRTRLVHILAERRGMVLQPSVAEALARHTSHTEGSVRDTEGLLTKLHAFASLIPSETTEAGNAGAVGHAILDRLLQSESLSVSRKPARFDTILAVVADRMRVSEPTLLGRSRHKHVVLARSLMIHLVRELTPMSYPEIARAMGKKNHSTVITAAQRIQRHLEENKPVLVPGEVVPVTPVDLADTLRHAVSQAS